MKLLTASALALACAAGAAADEPFSFDLLRGIARERAMRPHEERPSTLAPFWKDLTYAQHRNITFRRDRCLWADRPLGFQLEFFHPGWVFPRGLDLHEVVAGSAARLVWDAGRFDYHDLKVPEGTPPPDGHAGFRVLAPVNGGDGMDELAAFLGGTYFRAVGQGMNFGLSARVLALDPDPAGGGREELPAFSQWWLERPEEGSREFRAAGLFESPNVCGAAQFRIQPGRETVTEVEVEVAFRGGSGMVGFTPFSTMCWVNDLTQPRPPDYRPEVHDADGLLIDFGGGNAVWRPLDNPPVVRHSVFSAERFTGFGLLQRDRRFESYQDLEARYEKRPGVWVEPVGEWPAGRIHLIETPSAAPDYDNVVCCWEPAVRPEPGKPFRLAYRIHWLADRTVDGLRPVLASRRSLFPAAADKPAEELYVVDFAAPSPGEAGETTLAVEAGEGGTVVEQSLVRNPETGGHRAVLRVRFAPGTDSAELGCRLMRGEQSASEVWKHLWKRPRTTAP